MRSWSILIWLKRLAPLVIIAAVVLGVRYYREASVEHHIQEDREMARLTARVWLASAVFRERPDRYKAYRDSVLTAENISNEQMNEYLKAYGDDTEKFSEFTLLVKQYIDSLSDKNLWQDQIDALKDTLSDK